MLSRAAYRRPRLVERARRSTRSAELASTRTLRVIRNRATRCCGPRHAPPEARQRARARLAPSAAARLFVVGRAGFLDRRRVASAISSSSAEGRAKQGGPRSERWSEFLEVGAPRSVA